MLNLKQRMQSDEGATMSTETVLLLLVTVIIVLFVGKTVYGQVTNVTKATDDKINGLTESITGGK